MQNELQDLVKLTKQYIQDLQEQGVKEIASTKKSAQNESLQQFYLQIKNCQKCDLAKTRTKFVFGEGSAKAQLVFVGEAPGYDEDQQGRPFVGRAGKLLTKIITAMGLERKDVFICNILKCRPPGNRSPLPEEVQACRPYLIKQLSLLKSKKVICALGLHGARGLLQLDLPMYAMRSKWYEYEGTPVMVTYHPAYLLRNPAAKNKVWYDMKKVRDKCLPK